MALSSGVRRFVLLSASSLEAGGPMMGQVHAYLQSMAPEWAVLRPSWFMQNFSEQQRLATIRDEGAIYSATGAEIYAQILAEMDADVARGSEDRVTDGVVSMTGRQPTTFDAFIERNIGRWRKDPP